MGFNERGESLFDVRMCRVYDKSDPVQGRRGLHGCEWVHVQMLFWRLVFSFKVLSRVTKI